MDLHYSQTMTCSCAAPFRFHYLMDLHYSQTICSYHHKYACVSLPYGFTLFSNPYSPMLYAINVSLPYGFTLFSNLGAVNPSFAFVSLPYGFTLFSNVVPATMNTKRFHYLMDLHYSQTAIFPSFRPASFHYLMDLHYSQTHFERSVSNIGFTTLWIYTILKPLLRKKD